MKKANRPPGRRPWGPDPDAGNCCRALGSVAMPIKINELQNRDGQLQIWVKKLVKIGPKFKLSFSSNSCIFLYDMENRGKFYKVLIYGKYHLGLNQLTQILIRESYLSLDLTFVNGITRIELPDFLVIRLAYLYQTKVAIDVANKRFRVTWIIS